MVGSIAMICLEVLLFIACLGVLVNAHPLLSKRDALHHGRAALIEEIGAPGRDGTRL